MPYLYIVEKKIKIGVILITIILISIISSVSVFFVYTYIQRKRLASVYDYMDLGDYDNASFIFTSLYEKYPLDEDLLWTGIDLYYDILIRSDDISVIRASSERVAAFAKQMLLVHPSTKKRWLLFQRLANSYKNMGESYFPDAYDAYRLAMDLGDDRLSTLIDIAEISYNIERFSEAVVYLERAIDESLKENTSETFNTKLLYELAIAYMGNLDYTRAVEILSNLDVRVKQDPALSMQVYSKLGEIYFKQGLYTESEFFYKRSLELDINNAELYYSIGVLYQTMKRRSEAISMFREAIRLDSKHRLANDALRRL